MTFSAWDITIITLVALQCAAIVCLVAAVLRIKNGFIPSIIQRVHLLRYRVTILGVTWWKVALVNYYVVERTLHSTEGIAHGIGVNDRMNARMPINYRSMLAAYSSLRTVRGFIRQAKGLFRKKRTTPPGPKAALQRSIPDRLGLVPPAARHLGRLTPFLSTAIGAYRELRRRGIL